MNSYIEKHIDSVSKDVSSISDIASLNHTEKIGDKTYIASSFQLSLFYEVLQKIKLENTSTGIQVRQKLYQNYYLYAFKYFEGQILPDDLDTATSITRSLSDSIIINHYLHIVKDNSHNREQKTWMINSNIYNQEYFKKTFIYKNKDYYHIDVQLNHLLTTLKFNLIDIDLDSHLINLFSSYGFNNYWYYSSLYTISLSSKLLPHIKNKNLKEMIFLEFQKEIISNYLHLDIKCPINRVKTTYREHNNSMNWLNNYLALAIIANFEKDKTINQSEIQNIFNIIKERINNNIQINSPIYWSVNNNNFHSKSLDKIIFLNTILD